MMRTLRDKRTIQVVIWGLIAAFVFVIFLSWGMRYAGLNNDNKDPNLLAKVGDKTITFEEVNKACARDLERLYSSADSPPNEEIKQLKEETLNHLIDQSILELTAQKMGINVSIEELAAELQREPSFLDQNHKFDKARYSQFLQNRQLTPQEFEALVLQQKILQKIQTVLMDSILYTPDEIKNYAEFLGRSLKADYVELDKAKYEAEVPLTDESLKDYYENNKTQYDHPERVKVRHILIGLRENMTPQDDDNIKKKLEDFRSKILSGKSKFADLAKQYSEDQGSKTQGGELGWFPRGAFVKEFEDVAFKLKKGEISQPFKTQFGYHIVLLEDYEKAYKSTFLEMRSKVEKQYQQQKAYEKMASLSRQLSLKLQKNNSLAQAAGELKLKLQTTSWFNRETGIPQLKSSKELANSLADTYLNDWKGPIPFRENNFFFQIIDSKLGEPDSEKLGKDPSEITERLVASKREEWLKNYLEEQKKELKVKTYSNRI